MVLKVLDEESFRTLKKRLESDPRLTVAVKREAQFYADQSEMMARFIRILGLSMTIIFSFGAMIGAMVTMYAAVANRTVEIGTLRPRIPTQKYPGRFSDRISSARGPGRDPGLGPPP